MTTPTADVPKEPQMRVDPVRTAGLPARYDQVGYDRVFDAMERLRIAAADNPSDTLSGPVIKLVMATLNAFSRGTATVAQMNAVYELAASIDGLHDLVASR